jgi:uroporphyrinogen decarboxylase
MSTMTRREVLLRVLARQPTERIPVSPFIHVNYVKEFFGSHDVDWVARTPDVYRHFGFDVMHRNCSIAYDPYGATTGAWAVTTDKQVEGRDETTATTVRTPRGELHAVEALRWVYEYDAETSPIEFLIKSAADLDRLMQYQPPVGDVDCRAIRRAREAVGEDGIVAPWIQGAFNLVAYYYRKVDELLVDALVRPDFYHRMMTFCLERYKTWVQQVLDARPDVLCAGGNIANGKMVGPAFFREHIWPYEKQLIDFVQQQGVTYLYHNCGYARKLLPLYPSLGMGAYESLTPPPYGNTSLEEAIAVFGEGTTLLGNIDQIDLLRYGTPAQIAERVEQVLRTVRGRSHFILATTDYFNENTPQTNIHALADAGRRYGAC